MYVVIKSLINAVMYQLNANIILFIEWLKYQLDYFQDWGVSRDNIGLMQYSKTVLSRQLAVRVCSWPFFLELHSGAVYPWCFAYVLEVNSILLWANSHRWNKLFSATVTYLEILSTLKMSEWLNCHYIGPEVFSY